VYGRAWEERVAPTIEHLLGKLAHYWLSLDMEIAQYLIQAPAPQEADGAGVNMRTKESHDTGRTKGLGTNFGREEAKAMGAKDVNQGAQRHGDVGARHKVGRSVDEVRTEGSVVGGIVLVEVMDKLDASHCSVMVSMMPELRVVFLGLLWALQVCWFGCAWVVLIQW
jgi:hypothetical protein